MVHRKRTAQRRKTVRACLVRRRLAVLAADSVDRAEKQGPVPDRELVPARAVERAVAVVVGDDCAARAHEFWKAQALQAAKLVAAARFRAGATRLRKSEDSAQGRAQTVRWLSKPD